MPGLRAIYAAPKAPRAINGPDQEPVNAYMDLDRKCI